MLSAQLGVQFVNSVGAWCCFHNLRGINSKQPGIVLCRQISYYLKWEWYWALSIRKILWMLKYIDVENEEIQLRTSWRRRSGSTASRRTAWWSAASPRAAQSRSAPRSPRRTSSAAARRSAATCPATPRPTASLRTRRPCSRLPLTSRAGNKPLRSEKFHNHTQRSPTLELSPGWKLTHFESIKTLC